MPRVLLSIPRNQEFYCVRLSPARIEILRGSLVFRRIALLIVLSLHVSSGQCKAANRGELGKKDIVPMTRRHAHSLTIDIDLDIDIPYSKSHPEQHEQPPSKPPLDPQPH